MISNFIPELWSSQLLMHLRARLVYAAPALSNRDYEGEIQSSGDTVHITQVGDPTVGDYTAEQDISVESISDDTRALIIDQAKYFAFDVDDVIRKQAIDGWVAQATQNAAYKMAEKVDTYLSGIMYAGVNQTANDYGAFTVDISDNTGYNLLVNLRTVLTKSNVPVGGRWCVVPPEMYAALLQDNRFINAQASADGGAALRNGFVGRAAGFDVYESNTVPQPTSGTFAILAGHPMACTYAEQINSVEAMRREFRFGDLVKGLHLFGAKVVQPKALALASATVQA